MKRIFIRLAAIGLAVVLACAFAACTGKKAEGLTEKETARVVELARTFRIFGEYDSEEGFELRRYEYLVYSAASWRLKESGDFKGYGRISHEEAKKLAEGAAVGAAADTLYTKYKPSEIQAVFTIGDDYFVQLSDDSAYEYEVSSVKVLKDENGSRTGVLVIVGVTGGESDFSVSLELKDDAENVFKVKKCELHSSI